MTEVSIIPGWGEYLGMLIFLVVALAIFLYGRYKNKKTEKPIEVSTKTIGEDISQSLTNMKTIKRKKKENKKKRRQIKKKWKKIKEKYQTKFNELKREKVILDRLEETMDDLKQMEG